MLENTPLKPSTGDVISHFVDNLASEPRDWVLQQAPADWYSSVREAYIIALQWETNNSHRAESLRKPAAYAKVFTHVKGDKKRDFKRDSPAKRKSWVAGRHNAKRARTEGQEKPREHKIPEPLYRKRIEGGLCWKCGLSGHRATVCKNGFHDENGKTIA